MKKFLNYFLLASLVTLFVVSCKPEEDPYYEGDSQLFFISTSAVANVVKQTNFTELELPYGTTKAVDGGAQTELIFDAANSTAVLGQTFQIVKGTEQLPNGAVKGTFKIKVLESGVSEVPKTAKFKVKSSSIKNGIENQELTVTMSIVCPASTFVGNFKYSTGFWQNPNSNWVIQEVAGQANTMKIVDFLSPGRDLVFKYTTQGVVTFETGITGETYPGYGNISIRMSTDATKVSTINMCSRKLTIYANYFVTGGVLTDDNNNQHIKEEFTGF